MSSVTVEQAQLTLRRMAAYLRDHASASPHLEAWAEFFEAMPPSSEEALAFARAQGEIGFPERFTPRCDNGLFMRAYGLADTPPPSPGTLRELVALEGRDEPLPPGAYFPMEPTPVRDGRPLWEVEVRVITDDPDLWYRWQDVDELAHPRLEEVRGHGIGELPDGSDLLSTGLRIWATDGAEAQVIAGELIDDLVGAAETRRRLEVSPAYSDEYFELPRSPEDYESQLVAKRWQRAQASPAGVKIAWFTGPCPLERVDVRETPERVTITLWERYPPSFRPGGVMTAIAAIGITRCVEVPLQQPLATRVVIDGRTGTTPEDIDDFDYIERNTYEDLARADLDKFPCQPIPRLDRTP